MSEGRVKVLRDLGCDDPSVQQELLEYNQNNFDSSNFQAFQFPLADEPFVEAWREYADLAEQTDLLSALRPDLVQLQFPIREGISEDAGYQAATRKGQLPEGGTPLELERPDLCELDLHATPAGTIPCLISRHRPDFEALVRALTRRNEPVPIPVSMGACMVAGYNNWGRVRRYRADWEAEQSFPAGEAAWQAQFKKLIPQKELYQDRFILLSDGPYSGVPAEALGMGDDEWREKSLLIRREHECTHYFTRRVFSSMRNNLIDELIADYMGMLAAIGEFRAGWFLHFVGLEDFPTYREGGRLQNYRGDPTLSDVAFTMLQRLVKEAAQQVEHFDRNCRRRLQGSNWKPALISLLTSFTLEELASPEAENQLTARLAVAGAGSVS